MPKLQTRDEAMAVLQPFASLDFRTFAPTSTYGFDRNNKGTFTYRFGDKGDTLPITTEAWAQAVKMSGVSPKLGTEVPSELIIPVIDHQFRARSGEINAVIQDGLVAGFTKADYEPHNPVEILQLMEQGVGGEKRIKGYRVSGDIGRQFINIVTRKSGEVGTTQNSAGAQVGDIINMGITAYNSPLGIPGYGNNSPFSLSDYLERLVCTNGAVGTQMMSTFNNRKSENDFSEWLVDRTQVLHNQAELEFDRIRALKDTPLPDHTSQALDGIFREFGVPTSVRDMVMRRNADFPAHNLFDFWNHITYVASHYRIVQEDPNMVRRMMLAGGNILQNQNICQTCGHVEKRRRSIAVQDEQLQESAV